MFDERQISRIFLKSTFLIVALFIINSVAIIYHLFTIFWWFDIFAHFLGGCWLGVVSVWLLLVVPQLSHKFSHKPVLFAIIFILAATIGWEIFEIVVNIVTGLQSIYILDSISDVFNGFAGGLLGFALILGARKEVMRKGLSKV